MAIDVNIKKQLTEKHRHFQLNVQFQADSDFLVLFGPSGAGKSLTLQSIAGLITPEQGNIKINNSVLFDSETHVNIPVHCRNIGYLPQNYALFPHLTVADNIGFGLKKLWQWKLSHAEKQRVHNIMSLFEIATLAHSFPRSLSGGQQQRVALARALVCKPSLLLLDEPFAALNPLLRTKMRNELLQIQKLFQVPVVIITHDQADVDAFGETVIVIDDGKAQQICAYKEQLRETPALSVTNLMWANNSALN
ncbi:ABC transporter ATP-binding protein [Beggiatoa leptomitoformis]|uniref:ATP-binding cassette domain-containing protein n=1 Tax=Beggiatoa leptomitoformis TaxID=288004 RepID=A0A2N9YEH2_9GAMM|nr:ABC transporter ATP-binding protein [Beggiatoa leptomitoformis]ALG68743.1 ATP-binding cassette domain-containing protein [Beggiatoa leptomitoformis]AUI68898.1 ATP-binding cassette domain-containing protein [Beggiatoa leptomitoformis]